MAKNMNKFREAVQIISEGYSYYDAAQKAGIGSNGFNNRFGSKGTSIKEVRHMLAEGLSVDEIVTRISNRITNPAEKPSNEGRWLLDKAEALEGAARRLREAAKVLEGGYGK